MEKRKPHYPLSFIQQEARRRGAAAFTRTALVNGREMGLTVGEMVEIIAGLKMANFYKSMTTHADHARWQDVYHAPTLLGKIAYIKVCGSEDGAPPVIQFKEK